MKTKFFQISVLFLASAAGCLRAESGSIDSSAAFARLKTLVGEWRAETGKGQAHVSYVQ